MTVMETTPPSSPPAAPRARPVNVLMVTDHLGHAGGVIHGASRYYLQVLPRIDQSRFKITLCILRERHPFADVLEKAGVHPIFLNRAKWDPRALSDLFRLTRRLQPDLLHCLAMKGCLFGRMVGRALKIPALIHLHDTNEPGAVIGPLQRTLAPWTVRALAVSQVVREYTVTKLGMDPDRVETLYNGLDVDHFANPADNAREVLRAGFGLPPDARVILLAGRMVETKGQRLLIRMMPHILATCPTARLLLVGDGPDLPHCRRLVAELGLEGSVVMTGQRSDIPEVIAASDIAVMPSLQTEGFGFAALEAAAGGRPVVAFDGGAIAEIIEHDRTGYIIPRGDEPALFDAIMRLLADSDLNREMGRRAAQHAQGFAIAHHVEQLQNIYDQIVQGTAPSLSGVTT